MEREDQANFLLRFSEFLSSLKDKSYYDISFDIVEKFGEEFRDSDFLLQFQKNKEISNFLAYSPFHVSFDSDLKSLVYKREKLIHHVSLIENQSQEKLVSVGNGVIDGGGIIIVGMSAGFRGENNYDTISFPFKPSFYFGNASRILRFGLMRYLNEIYFTNLAKYALSKSIMNTPGKYQEVYEECFPYLEEELKILKPRLILAAGINVYEALRERNIPCSKIKHPSYFFFREGADVGIKYYESLNLDKE